MLCQHTLISGVYELSPQVIGDERGFFMEVFRKDVFNEWGLGLEFVQVNQSRSKQGVIRGMHLQFEPPLSKLIRVIRGSALFITVDARLDSATVGKWIQTELSEDNKKLLFVPPGCASGFCVLSDTADVEYHCSVHYNPNGEVSIRWNDPDIGIAWPVQDPIISKRDKHAISFQEWLKRF